MRILFSVFSLLMLVSIPSFALQTVISGTAKKKAGKSVSLWIYDDYITYSESELASSKVSADGSFELIFDITETQYAFLSIENEYADLYITGGQKYKVHFPETEKNANENSPFFERVFRKLKFEETDSSSLNLSIIRFNRDYDEFLTKNYPYFHSKGITDKIRGFETTMSAKYGNDKNRFFNHHITYSIADAEQTTSVRREVLFNKYISGKPVSLRHLEYMNFFRQFYEKKLEMFILTEKGKPLIKAINEKADFAAALEILSTDPELNNDTLRQALLVKDLERLYLNPSITKEKVLVMLDNISKQSKIKEIQKAASNLRKRILFLSTGTQAPAFEFQDQNGQKITLNSLKGKYVYLEFTSVACALCLSETKLIPALRKKYGHKIEFVTVFIGDDALQIKNFTSKLGQEWLWLRAARNHPVLAAYGLKAIPTYFLISPDGTFYESPGRKPSEGIERAFTDISKKKF